MVTERVYLVPRDDGRLVVGATVEEQGFDTRVTAGGVHELLREAYRALPEIAELELVETIAGLRPATPDNLPLIGAGAIDGPDPRDRALPQRDPARAAHRPANRRRLGERSARPRGGGAMTIELNGERIELAERGDGRRGGRPARRRAASGAGSRSRSTARSFRAASGTRRSSATASGSRWWGRSRVADAWELGGRTWADRG